ncbi:Holliday junction branch migration protein RuvA [Pseudogracilibacillus auburnensis]|uniref:Holliday junction branch migration complex subunit RuvA n=1 Tax=Pseudogracilibacillus auburnensis TaxID=1494959 RepID=A0A2V3W2X0_9BACI|nr:Holliday junction branch migration protein RuvA [Pseudogracilibacillus auburnensis]MBO1003408.1 Holliday junction branch migration protein RuvA [Pseudogracilibacillus auburnensis]PXW86605.1 Holliday junction DNA helicase subunit RuvA [Pseudogracilibacillus auburnensis]
MIAYIKGKVTFIQEESIIIEVAGIGYEIICPNPFIFQSSLQKELFIYTYHHVREDIQCLYGFKDEDEKYLFTKLISVSGIGPKSAITILGSVHVPDFIAAVEREDEKYLTQFPGVGKKTARQIILDLKGKLINIVSLEGDRFENKGQLENSIQLTEAKEALKALGYSDREISGIMPTLQKEEIDETDRMIKKALTLLVKN